MLAASISVLCYGLVYDLGLLRRNVMSALHPVKLQFKIQLIIGWFNVGDIRVGSDSVAEIHPVDSVYLVGGLTLPLTVHPGVEIT